MKLRSISYYFREAFTNLTRNGIMTVASIGTVAACIFMLVASFCIVANLDFFLKQFGSNMGFTIIVTDSATTEDVNIVYEAVKNIPYVNDVRYISAQEALEKLKTEFKDTEGLLAGLENDNPLPRSFEITIQDPKFQGDVIKTIQGYKSPAIEEIRYESEVVNMLVSVNQAIRIVSIVIIAALIAVSVVIIINTVKLTVNNRKIEINIMKYVGATDWFIRWPFIIEGILIGIIGALIPVALSWLFYGKIIDLIYENMKMLKNLLEFRSATEIMMFLAPTAFIVGAIIGAAGSITSIRKYLKV